MMSASYVHCNVCLADFSVASGGVHDLKRLINSKKQSDLHVHNRALIIW